MQVHAKYMLVRNQHQQGVESSRTTSYNLEQFQGYLGKITAAYRNVAVSPM